MLYGNTVKDIPPFTKLFEIREASKNITFQEPNSHDLSGYLSSLDLAYWISFYISGILTRYSPNETAPYLGSNISKKSVSIVYHNRLNHLFDKYYYTIFRQPFLFSKKI
jgi:hypothetical protein